jgi:hypothetical protein
MFFSIFLSIQASANEDVPSWLKARISGKNPPLMVEKYLFKKKTTYLIMTTCCDHGFRELYNVKGKLICKLPESIVGLDDSACRGFNDKSERVSQIFPTEQSTGKH